ENISTGKSSETEKKTPTIKISTSDAEKGLELKSAEVEGTTIKEAVITLRKPGGEPYERIKLTDVVIAGHYLSGSSESSPTWSFTLAAGEVETEFIHTPEPSGPVPAPTRTGPKQCRSFANFSTPFSPPK